MIEINEDLCSECNYCVLSCGQGALLYQDYHIIIDFEKCENCGACYYYCPNKAIRIIK
ncbi:MAG: 4Fe-4S binding protein [Candidatus Helarchaeota archaeon]